MLSYYLYEIEKYIYFFFIIILLPSTQISKVSDLFSFSARLISKGMLKMSVLLDVFINFLSNLIMIIYCNMGLNIYGGRLKYINSIY